MLTSFLHFKSIAVDRGDFEDTQAYAVEEVETKTVKSAVANTEFFEDEERLVLTSVDARVEGRLESVANQRFDSASVGEAFVCW